MLDWQWNMDEAQIAWENKGREEGISIGEVKKAEVIAAKMLRKGKDFSEIQEWTDLPMQRIKELAKSN